MDRVDKGLEEIDKELKENMKKQPKDTRTLANFANISGGDEDNSTVELVGPDDAHTKGRPRLMTIVSRQENSINAAIVANTATLSSHVRTKIKSTTYQNLRGLERRRMI